MASSRDLKFRVMKTFAGEYDFMRFSFSLQILQVIMDEIKTSAG